MTDTIALVTGANGGLGTHVTRALLEAGYVVAGLAPNIRQSDFDHPRFTAIAAKLESSGWCKRCGGHAGVALWQD